MGKITNAKFDIVMVIDDNSIDLYINARMIETNGFSKNVIRHSSAESALQYLSENQENTKMLPQIILVDIYMPMMSGFEFMEAYDKFSPSLKDYCRVYIVSSSIDDNDIARANNDPNVIAFQEKPVTKDFLESIPVNGNL